MLEDVRHGFRLMARKPGFTAAAVLTLALGIGANTALFNVLDEALLRPLPLPQPDRLAAVFNLDTHEGRYISSSYPDYEDYARRSRSFERLAAYVRFPLNLTIGEDTDLVPVEAVTANYFAMLELAPLAGRAFEGADESPGAVPVAMLSENLWRARYQADPAFVGKTIRLGRRDFIVAGIVPKRYRGANLNWSEPPQVWIPLFAAPLVIPQFAAADMFHRRAARWLLMIGRLKPGVAVSAAQAELRLIAGNLARSESTADRDVTSAVFPATRAKFWPAYRASVERSIAVLGAAAILVLLLACANVSNLLLERAFSRRREFAIRLSLGARRGRLIAQLLVENALLAAPGLALAVVLATGLGRLLARFPNAFGVRLALDSSMGGCALLFCSALSLAATLLFGLAPALRASRAGIQSALKESGNAASGRTDWLRSGLVVVQVAFSMVLLIGGGLFARSLLKAYAADPGFRPSHMLIAGFNLAPDEFAGERGQQFSGRIARQVAHIPGVEAAAVAWNPPLTPVRAFKRVAAEGSSAASLPVLYNMVGPDYMRAMGIGLIGGREFTAHDDRTSAKVAILNQTLARRLFGATNPVGRAIFIDEAGARRVPLEIVGLARDARYGSVWDAPEPYLYLPVSQSGIVAANVVARTLAAPPSVASALRSQWPRIAPGVPLDGVRTGEEQVNASLAPQRVAAGLLACFGVLAIVLASVGLYGVMAFAVAQRTREIGIRMAVGAAPGVLVRGILAGALRLAAAGIALGAAVSFALMRLVASLVKEVSPHDAATYVAVAVLLAAVSAGAALLPAVRAARVDPLAALKCE